MTVTTMSSFKALVIREYWEHRRALLIAPASIAVFFAGLLILGAITGDMVASNNGHEFFIMEHLPKAVEEFENLGAEEREQGVQIGLYAPRVLFGFIMLIICLFYALASLYDERKDRSILFWKSLPISDTATVLSKMVTVCLAIPIMYFVVITGFQLFLLLYATIVAWFGGSIGVTIWTSSNLFSVLFNGLFSMITASLWLAPLWAWLIFASSWAKKTAFLWGTLPIFLLSIAEAWIFQTGKLVTMITERIADGFIVLNSNLNHLVGNEMFEGNSIEWYSVFGNTEFWGGLIVSGVFLAGAIYIRRFRDES